MQRWSMLEGYSNMKQKASGIAVAAGAPGLAPIREARELLPRRT